MSGFSMQQHQALDQFVQIMRRDIRGHAHGDAGGAIDQQVRNARRQDHRLIAGLVEIRNEIDGFLLEVREQVPR